MLIIMTKVSVLLLRSSDQAEVKTEESGQSAEPALRAASEGHAPEAMQRRGIKRTKAEPELQVSHDPHGGFLAPASVRVKTEPLSEDAHVMSFGVPPELSHELGALTRERAVDIGSAAGAAPDPPAHLPQIPYEDLVQASQLGEGASGAVRHRTNASSLILEIGLYCVRARRVCYTVARTNGRCESPPARSTLAA